PTTCASKQIEGKVAPYEATDTKKRSETKITNFVFFFFFFLFFFFFFLKKKREKTKKNTTYECWQLVFCIIDR
ncbi:hypothetical protein, partial [Corynebacterium diphtheriae]|uniref:hypothetical protein n=1 Tax=Corynebacterium diphtheriae TaxID=1717 RepID=UPI000D438BB1